MSSSFRCSFLALMFYGFWPSVTSSRILVVVPTPMHSHQVVFRPFTQELVRRGHHVVVLTTDPAFSSNQAPQNLTEIDLHDISYKYWTGAFQKAITGKQSDFRTQAEIANDIMFELFQIQMQTEAVKKILTDNQFDLVVVEAWVYQALALAHIYRAPAILMSTLGIEDETFEDAGAPIHPILYPDWTTTRRYNLSGWQLAKHLYARIDLHWFQNALLKKQDLIVKKLFGADVPPLQEIRKEAEAYYLSWHYVWQGSRPMPLSVVHLGSLHCVSPKELPENLKYLMDSSKHGVIYMSFGSHANPSLLPPERLEVFARVFAMLPYDVIWKWKDTPRLFSSNVHTFSWLPQSDLLRHEKVVLFITQGGLQSTEEALRAGVPMLGIPLLMDQWINIENYERLGVGLGLDFHMLTEFQLTEAIETLINDKSYRNKSASVGRDMLDRPQSALDRAVWGAERAIRLRGRRMRTPPPSLTWDDVIQAAILAVLVVPVALIAIAYFLCRVMSCLKRKMLRICCGFFKTFGSR